MTIFLRRSVSSVRGDLLRRKGTERGSMMLLYCLLIVRRQERLLRSPFSVHFLCILAALMEEPRRSYIQLCMSAYMLLSNEVCFLRCIKSSDNLLFVFKEGENFFFGIVSCAACLMAVTKRCQL